MDDEILKPDSNVKSAIDSAIGLVKAIPVYQDIIQPSAKQLGKSLETVTKTINIALAPIKALVWGYEQIEGFVTSRLSEKLNEIPVENIIPPIPQIAGPSFEALRYTGHDENIRELFVNLLATAMNKETIHKAHPGYVEVIKNLSSDEAILLSAFISNKAYPLINIYAEHKEKKKIGKQLIYSHYTHLDRVTSLNCADMLPLYINKSPKTGTY